MPFINDSFRPVVSKTRKRNASYSPAGAYRREFARRRRSLT